MKLPKATLVLIFATILTAASDAQTRKWTANTGQTTEAEFVELRVALKKADGEVIAVPLSRLSKGDRDFVLSMFSPSSNAPGKNELSPKISWCTQKTLANANPLEGEIELSAEQKRLGNVFLVIEGEFPTKAFSKRIGDEWQLIFNRSDFVIHLSDGTDIKADAFAFGTTGFWAADVSSKRKNLADTEKFSLSFIIPESALKIGKMTFQVQDQPSISLNLNNKK